MSLFNYYDNFNPDVNPPITRDKCYALKDPEHDVPTRCHRPEWHLGLHASIDWKGGVLEEWG